MSPLLTTLRNAMNSRKAMLNPTMTTKVIPVAGCCSTLARAICWLPFVLFVYSINRPLSSGNRGFRERCGWLFRSLFKFGFQFFLDLFNKSFESLLEGIAVAVCGSSDPERQIAAGILYGNHPEADVDHVEDERQTDCHQNDSGPYRPLAGFVRNFQPGENTRLKIFRFEVVGGGCVLGDAGNLGQPEVHDFVGFLRGDDQVHCGIDHVIAASIDVSVLYDEIGDELGDLNLRVDVEGDNLILG